jgi:ribosome modulation factor
MNLNLLRITIAGCAALFLLSTPRVHAAGTSQQGYYGQDHDWDRPPNNWNDIQRRGFHDGVEGARKDFGNHRQPDPDNRDEYRHPDNVPPQMWNAYRDAFRRGYQVGMSHFMNGGPQMAHPPMRAWDAVPDWFNDAQRRGFQDGMVGAQKDFGNHRQPDPNNRWEYQKPDMPPNLWEPYREGFRRGYAVAMSHLMGTPPPPPRPWNFIPPDYNDFQRRGFQDGIEGAQKDYGNHRQPNVNNREEYRDPDNIPPQMREAYRQGFRRGYDVGWDHIMGRDHDRY